MENHDAVPQAQPIESPADASLDSPQPIVLCLQSDQKVEAQVETSAPDVEPMQVDEVVKRDAEMNAPDPQIAELVAEPIVEVDVTVAESSLAKEASQTPIEEE